VQKEKEEEKKETSINEDFIAMLNLNQSSSAVGHGKKPVRSSVKDKTP